MSRDAGGGPAKRPRALERASVGWPRALRELKDLLYEVYLAAGAPSLDVIAREIAAEDDSLLGLPSRDTIRRCISGSVLPPGQADVVAVAVVLARYAAWDRQDLAARVRGLWVEARMAKGAGRPIEEFDDELVLADLEVHPALDSGATRDRLSVLPAYVPREFNGRLDTLVAAATAGQSGIAVLVGGSSTGKTRALWEAARKLPDTWRLWHPIAPTRPDALLAELPDIAPRTVVWLDEAQDYLGPDPLGEQVAAGLRNLLHDVRRGPVLVLATLWPQHWATLTTRTDQDRHAHARQLLRGHRIDVPDVFNDADLTALTATAGSDPRLVEAAERAPAAQITQYLAGVPVLMDRYQTAQGATRHLINAAMDARRLGAGPNIPLAWLADAVPGYFTDTEWNATGDWLPQALDYVTRECNGIPGILTPVKTGTPRNHRDHRPTAVSESTPRYSARDTAGSHYQLADYLDQYGRRHRADQVPPIDFWTAAATHAHPADLYALGDAARKRGLYRDAAQLHKRATTHGDSHAPAALVDLLHSLHPTDPKPAQWAAAHVNLGDSDSVVSLLESLTAAGADEQTTALLARNPAAHVSLGDSDSVVSLLESLTAAGADEQTTALLARNPAAHVNLHHPYDVASLLESLTAAGADEQTTALLARNPAAHVNLDSLWNVSVLLKHLTAAGADEQAAALATRAAAHGALDDLLGVTILLVCLTAAGADEQAAALATRAAAHGALDDLSSVSVLLKHLTAAGADEQAAALATRAAAHGALDDLSSVAALLKHLTAAGADEQAAALATRAAAHGALDDLLGVTILLVCLTAAGADEQAAVLAARAGTHVALDNPHKGGQLAERPRMAVMYDQAAALTAGAAALDDLSFEGWLLARLTAAGAVDLHDPYVVGALLDSVTGAGADEQAAALAAWAGAHVSLDDPHKVGQLVEKLRMAGADDQAAALAARLPAAGRFTQFITMIDDPKQFRFGREPDGSAAPSWGWEDLE